MVDIGGRIVVINSEKRSSGTDENFTIQVPSSLFLKNVTRVKVIDAHIPHSWYTLTDTEDNGITFNEGGGDIATTVDANSFYDADTLATALGDAMTAAGGQTYTVTFDTATQKYTISATGGFSIDFSAAGSIAPFLGFSPSSLATNTSHESDGIADFIADKYIYIKADFVQGIDQGVIELDENTTPVTKNILAAIPIRAQFALTMDYDEKVEVPFVEIKNSNYHEQVLPATTPVNFWLERSSGKALDLNNHTWSARLLINFN